MTLTYTPDERPEEIEGAKKDREEFLRHLRRHIKREGGKFKYILVTEIGKRGSVTSSYGDEPCTDRVVRKEWPKGRIDIRPLDDTGQYSRLAEYFTKYKYQFQKMGGKGHAWTRSTNLHRPETKKRIITNRECFRQEPRDKKGYWIDKGTVYAGISELTGWGFMRYILVENDGRRGSR